jgi:hypothetical protein
MVRFSAFALLLCLLAGCATRARWVPVSFERFSPKLSEHTGRFKDKPLLLRDFTNNAQNTQHAVYFGTSKRRRYGNPNSGAFGVGGRPLDVYFWYCFEKALTTAGFVVHKEADPPPNDAPSLRITLVAISETNFTFTAEAIARGMAAANKEFVIEEPPPGQDASTAQALESRAYLMMNRSIEAVLSDPDFLRVLTSGAAAPAASPAAPASAPASTPQSNDAI